MSISSYCSHRFLLSAWCVLATMAGCSPSSNPGSRAETSAAKEATGGRVAPRSDAARPRPSVDAPGSAIALREADEEVYRQVLDAQRGQVVLVDFWATWCLPCKKNFPKIVSYGQKYGGQGLALVSLSIDDATAREDALDFLKSVKATGTHMISKWGAGTESAERFDFSGEVPFYRLYDRGGKLRYQFCANAETIERVEPWEQLEPRIKELLSEGATQ